jgi:hypothetical protein
MRDTQCHGLTIWGWFIAPFYADFGDGSLLHWVKNNMISHLFPVLVHHFCVQHVRQNLQ